MRYPPPRRGFSDELVEETKRMFQPYREEPITDYDAQDMLRNLTGFFEVLLEWDQKDREEKAAAEAEAAISDGVQKGKGGSAG